MATTRFFIGGTGASATIHINDDGSCELVIYDYHGDTVECRDYKTYRGARTALGIFSGGFQREVTAEEYSAFDRYEWCGGKHEENEVNELYIKTELKTETYHLLNAPYFVDIVERDTPNGRLYEAWLCRDNYCLKSYLFGGFVKDYDGKNDFVETVFYNIYEDILNYDEEMEWYEEATEERMPTTEQSRMLCNWEQTVALMDDELREEVHNELCPCTKFAFLKEYMLLHEDKYGEAFTI